MSSDVNERIARALGCKIREDTFPLVCEHGSGLHRIPDYENSIDACMEVIRKRWPKADIEFSTTLIGIPWARISGWRHLAPPSRIFGHGEGSTDASRLAYALAEALEAENED